MRHAKFLDPRNIGSGEEDFFKVFIIPYMGVAAIFVM